ncbi:histidine kinase [Piscinibacter sakaiensis]|uniref:histidine kinase n=1 Tax=Piscinibacter sakaiensis TaxID=1547922 RepID=UPI00372BB5A6
MAASSTPTPTSARPGPAERTRRRDAAGDALAVGLFTGLVWLVAGRFDFLERYLRLTGRLEHWQVDELVFATTAFVLGLTWVALRRWREALRASAMHQAAEQRVAELLAHNRELAQQLISVQEAERRALARELHDEVGQICSAIRVEAALVDRSGAAEPAATTTPSCGPATRGCWSRPATCGWSPRPTAPSRRWSAGMPGWWPTSS